MLSKRSISVFEKAFKMDYLKEERLHVLTISTKA